MPRTACAAGYLRKGGSPLHGLSALSGTGRGRPDGCRLEPVRGFSERLGERTLLFVGDSLTAQH